jgi:hypothetical protein
VQTIRNTTYCHDAIHPSNRSNSVASIDDHISGFRTNHNLDSLEAEEEKADSQSVPATELKGQEVHTVAICNLQEVEAGVTLSSHSAMVAVADMNWRVVVDMEAIFVLVDSWKKIVVVVGVDTGVATNN